MVKKAQKAQKTQKEQKKSGNGAVVAGILGVAAAAAAGAYFLYGTNTGKKKMKQIRGWALKAKGEVLEKMESLKEVNQEAYNKVIDAVLKRYESLKHIDATELVEVANELKGHWRKIEKELAAGVSTVSKMKKAGKTVVKRVASNNNASQKTAK